MTRELKMHMYRPDNQPKEALALCGKTTENGTDDPEEISCMSCSGIYRTNVEWYSQVKNRAVEARNRTGSGDIYTRGDVEAGLMRMGFGHGAVQAILNKTSIFRDVKMVEERDSAIEAWGISI